MCRVLGCAHDEGDQSGGSGRQRIQGERYPVLQAARVSKVVTSILNGTPVAYIPILYSSDRSMGEIAETLQAITKKHGGIGFEFAGSDAEAEAAWQGRKAALWSVQALKENGRVWTTDVW